MVESGNDAQRHARADCGFAVELPMVEAQAIVEGEECVLVGTGEAPGVLQEAFYAVGLERVLGCQTVDELQVVGSVGYAVAAGISHLILAALFLNVLVAIGECSQHVVLALLVGKAELHVGHGGLEVVAGMFHVCAHSEVLARFGLGEPVLSLYVVAFLLLGREGRGYERERGALGKLPGERERTEECAEHVFFVTVEVHLERLHVLHRAEIGLAVVWREVVVVLRDVAYEVYLPALAGRNAQVGLIVEEIGLVFALGFERAEHVAVGLVAHAVGPSEVLALHAHIGIGAEQAGCQRCFKMLGLLVGNVEGRRHLVAVFGFVAAR